MSLVIPCVDIRAALDELRGDLRLGIAVDCHDEGRLAKVVPCIDVGACREKGIDHLGVGRAVRCQVKGIRPVLRLCLMDVGACCDERIEHRDRMVVLRCEHHRGKAPFVVGIHISALIKQFLDIPCLRCCDSSGKKLLIQ